MTKSLGISLNQVWPDTPWSPLLNPVNIELPASNTPEHILQRCPSQHSLMPDMAAGGRAEREAVGMLPKPREDSGPCPGQQASDWDEMNKE